MHAKGITRTARDQPETYATLGLCVCLEHSQLLECRCAHAEFLGHAREREVEVLAQRFVRDPARDIEKLHQFP